MDVKTTPQKKPHLPIKTRFLISACMLAVKICTRPDATINRRLFSLLEPKAIAPATKLAFNSNTPVSSSDISVDPSRHLWFRLFIPKTTDSTCDKLPLIIYFHGGGFEHFGPDTTVYDSLCCRLAAEVPVVVASVNYRLSPEHKFPCAYDDGFDTLKFIDAQNYAVLPSNTDLSKCFIAGDSAGGNIAHHVTSRACKKMSDHEFERLSIIGFLGLQPFFGGEERTESELRLTKAPLITVERADRMWRNFLPEGANRNHDAANVFGGGSNSKPSDILPEEFPRSLVFTGGFDPLQDWQKRYCEGLRRFGKEVKLVEYPNGIHGFYTFPELPESALFVKEVREFIKKKV